MKISCWTMAPGGKLLPDFPLGMIRDGDVYVAGADFYSGDFKSLESNPKNFAACVNEAARKSREGLLVTLPPDLVALPPDWRARFLRAAERNPKGKFFYGDYRIRRKDGDISQLVRKDIGDITEREDWGPVWAVRIEALAAAAGLDEEEPRAAFYDLLLKCWGRDTRIHTGEQLGVVAAPPADEEADKTKDKLFFPGRGKLGGFSYLFMDKEEERQIENVFYNFLKRQGAWLEGERTEIPDSHRVTTPLISVVTPVFNRSKFIGKAIESVQAQTIADWEYIIVDNGSTDSTREVVKKYAEKDSRIRLVENDKNVIAVSLNIGVKHANGKYISQLDSDDEYLPHTLSKMSWALESNPTWGLAISYYELMNEKGEPLPEFGVIKHEQYNRNNILRRDGAGALRCWHRSVIQEFGGFEEKELGHYGEDYDLVLKCGEKYEVGRVHEVCYRYRRHDDNTDVLREPEMKIRNKTIARLHAIERRKRLNEK